MSDVSDSIKLSADDIAKILATPTAIGNLGKKLTNAMYGLSMNEALDFLPGNEDIAGFTFFIRPQLNLSTDNIKRHDKLAQLLTKSDGMHRAVRLMLDPHLAYEDIQGGKSVAGIKSSLIDQYSPFISILSNSMESLSGWPDPVVPTYISPAGVRKEQYGFVDGVKDIFNNYSLDLNNKNVSQDPITLMLDMWQTYMSATFADDNVAPYPAFIINREYDFNTRVYRFVLGINGRSIRKIGLTGASFPVNLSMGKFFDTSRETTLKAQSTSINTRLESFGALYNEYKYMHAFNLTVAGFNPEAAKIIYNRTPFKPNPALVSGSGLVRVPVSLYSSFKHRMVPIIDLEKMNLDFYIDKSLIDIEKIPQDKE